jgi:tetratricopeptide (TPR) repeat protein
MTKRKQPRKGRRKAAPRQATAENDAGPSSRPRFRLLVLIVIAAGLGLASLALRRSNKVDGPEPAPLKIELRGDASRDPDMVALEHEAVGVANEVAARYPADPAAQAVVAQLQYRFGRSQEALDAWEHCLRIDASYLEAYSKMASIAREMGDFAAAERHLRKVLNSSPENAALHLELGEVLLDQSRLDAALDALRMVPTMGPEATAAHVLRGQIYLQQRRYGEAKASFEKAARDAPDYAHAYHGLATASARLGDLEKAAEYRRRFDALRSTHRSRYPDPGGVARDLASLKKCVALTHTAAGQVYFAQGDLAGAEEHWRRAGEVFPGYTASRELLIGLYQRQAEPQHMRRLLEELAEIEPHNPRWFLQLGNDHALAGRFAAAAEAFQQAKAAAPEQPAPHVALAHLLLQADTRLEEARRSAETAVQLDPVAANYHVLALICQRLGDMEAAAAAAEQAVKLEPENSERVLEENSPSRLREGER